MDAFPRSAPGEPERPAPRRGVGAAVAAYGPSVAYVAVALAAAVCAVAGVLRGWDAPPVSLLAPLVNAAAFAIAVSGLSRQLARRRLRGALGRLPESIHPLEQVGEDVRLLVEFRDGSSAVATMPADYDPSEDDGALLVARLTKQQGMPAPGRRSGWRRRRSG